MLQPGEILTALHPATGAVRFTYPTPLGYANPRITVDADGRLFVSNGGFATGRVFSFNPDLTLRWSVAVPNVNIGGPALGRDGTLVIAGVGTDVRAYRTPSAWTDVGGGSAGTRGVPVFTGRGTLTAGNELILDLGNGPPHAISALVVGGAAVNVPLFGAVFAPRPDLVAAGLALDPAGSLSLQVPFPCGVGTGTGFWFQRWMPDLGTPFGVVASNGLRAITP
jgi:hypothetical protein